MQCFRNSFSRFCITYFTWCSFIPDENPLLIDDTLRYFALIFCSVCVYICMLVCLFAYSSRTDVPICTKLGILIPWNHEENIGLKLRKSVLSSSPGEGGSCSSETKRGRRTAPRPKLFVSGTRLQERRQTPSPPVSPKRKTTRVVHKEVLCWIFIIRT
jgi:hypothetical protein